MKHLALILSVLALLVGGSTVLSCHAARLRNPGAAPSRSTDRIAEALNGATNVMLYASTPGVTRAQRQLTLMGLVEEDEKRRLLEILDRSRPDTWIYVSCRHYLQCDASWFGIYVDPSKPEIGFDWTDFDALSAEATDAHAVFVCTEPELVEWVKDFTAKTRDGQTSPATNAPAAVPPFRLPGVRVGMTWDEFAAVRTNATLSAGKDAPRVQAGEPKESACEVLEGDFPFAVYSFSGDADGNALEEIVFFAKGGIDPEATIRAAVDCLGEPDVGKTVACQGTISDVLAWRDGRTLSVLLASVASEFGDEDDPSAGTEFRVCLDSERFRERFGVLDPSVRGTRSNPYPYLPKLPTTGEVVQYVHCRRGEPWEDIDRKTGEAVLSLVSDYRGYRRVNSKEPSFQRAWREGFVDLLLRGNDDVRHLTFSSDGAWLDVGDGYYYLAVPEEKRPELLKLLEPFERQTTSAAAPAASESHAESTEHGPDAEKWKRIVLPIVDFRQSRVVDVVEFLEDLARNYDDFVAAARGQGVTFVLDVPADAVDSLPLPLVTCKMKSVSVYSAIDTIAEMSGLEWSVDGDVIRLTLAPGRPAADETHAEAEDGVDGGCFGAAPSAEN